MRIAAAAAAICLASCAAALSQPAPQPADHECAESQTDGDSMCAWLALNANRAPGAFQGYYRAIAQELDAELAIVEESGGRIFLATNFWIGQGCTARFEGRRVGDRVTLAPAPELAIPGASCSAHLEHGAARDDVAFSMQQSCSSACRAPIASEPVHFRIADPPHD
jgi:hypothetical protein